MNIRFIPRRGLCLKPVGKHFDSDLQSFPQGAWVTDVCGRKRGHRGAHDDPSALLRDRRLRDGARTLLFYTIGRPLQWVVCKTGLHGKVGLRNDDGTIERVCLICKYGRSRDHAA